MKIMTEFKSSRFLLWEQPFASPFYDLIHMDNRGPVFDLGVVLNSYDGSVYIHQDDIIEMGRSLGMATAEEVSELMEEIRHLKEQVNRLPAAEKELRNGLDLAVDSFYRNLHSDESNVVPSPENPEPANDPDNESESEAIGTFKR